MSTATAPATGRRGAGRLVVFSLLGIFVFFVPITLAGKTTIPVDHAVSWFRTTFPSGVRWYALAVIVAGAVAPFVTGRWRRSPTDAMFAVVNIIGLGIGVLVLFGVGPDWLLAPSMGPYLYDSVVVAVGLIVPIGAVFLSLLTGYGLMELVGVLVQRFMRPVWRTPGRSSIDAVASFVGSYSIGLLITGRMYQQGRYTVRESAIIATGFSTVSATFMIVVATTIGFMDRWNLYFWSCLVVTFLVTALTARIPPLSRLPDSYHPDATPDPEEPVRSRVLRTAWDQGAQAAVVAPPLGPMVVSTVRMGFVMAMSILPAVLAFGMLGLVLATMTPVFEWIGLVFYPIPALLGLPDAGVVATGAAVSIADMFVPALLARDAAESARFVIGILCISEIIFFSGVVPCIHATGVPIGFARLLLIWAERVALTLLLAVPLARLVL